MQVTKKLISNPLRTKLIHDLRESEIIAIRHGESFFNLELSKVKQLRTEYSNEKWQRMRREVKFNDAYIDSGLTDKGIEQARKAGISLSEHNISTFIVSPLRRNILTCFNLLHSISRSSNKYYKENKIEILVNPYIYERIEDSCDYIKDINKTMKEFSSFDYNGLKIKLDWSRCIEVSHLPIYQLMFCDMTINEQLDMRRKEGYYYNKEVDSYKRNKRYSDFGEYLAIMDKLEEHHGYAIESNAMTMNRLMRFKEDLPVVRGKKVVVVGHSELFRHLFASSVDEDMNPIEKNVIGNCEMVGIEF
jgi:broad specificity phosphatase PhoE